MIDLCLGHHSNLKAKSVTLLRGGLIFRWSIEFFRPQALRVKTFTQLLFFVIFFYMLCRHPVTSCFVDSLFSNFTITGFMVSLFFIQLRAKF